LNGTNSELYSAMSFANTSSPDWTPLLSRRQQVQLPGITQPGLHEVYAVKEADGTSMTGFALGNASRLLTRSKTGRLKGNRASILWARHDLVRMEAGDIYPPGLIEFGISPSSVMLTHARNVQDVLQAGLDAARCSSLAAILIEFWGDARIYGLTASQRLAFAAKSSSVALYLLRHAAAPMASAAETRWNVKSLVSRPLAHALGQPAFEITLLRRRGGMSGQVWSLEWNRETRSFEDTGTFITRDKALSGHMAALPIHREAALRKAG
jgi:protein ImuA